MKAGRKELFSGAYIICHVRARDKIQACLLFFWLQSNILSQSVYWLLSNLFPISKKKVLNYMISDVSSSLNMEEGFFSEPTSGLLTKFKQVEGPCSVLRGNWAKLSWWLKCQMKQNLCEYSAVGDDRDSARLRVNRGYSLVIEMTKCALQTHFIIQDFLQPKSIQSSIHPCIRPISHLSIHPFNHPPILLFTKHLLNTYSVSTHTSFWGYRNESVTVSALKKLSI